MKRFIKKTVSSLALASLLAMSIQLPVYAMKNGGIRSYSYDQSKKGQRTQRYDKEKSIRAYENLTRAWKDKAFSESRNKKFDRLTIATLLMILVGGGYITYDKVITPKSEKIENLGIAVSGLEGQLRNATSNLIAPSNCPSTFAKEYGDCIAKLDTTEGITPDSCVALLKDLDRTTAARMCFDGIRK